MYRQKNPKTLIRITGRPPLEATAYELEQLRCNGCGQVFTAEAPAEAGDKKYDESAVAMIAQLRYGSGVPFQRLERLEANLGIPLPAATQWEVVEEKAESLQPALEELIRQAAQGEVAHNDDTGMRILKLAREPAPEGKAERSGVFTSGIVSRVGCPGTTATRWHGSPRPRPRNMMNPAWPKTIDCGLSRINRKIGDSSVSSFGHLRWYFGRGRAEPFRPLAIVVK